MNNTTATQELNEVIALHQKWLNDDEDGVQANLRGANLTDADLTGADLAGVNGNLRHIKSMQTEKYCIAYTATNLQIGCQRHLIEEWQNFSDETIAKMDKGALEWWSKWKPIIMQIIEMAPCEPTKG